jgi:alpha-beta hydrolase superfamily lysophospholipase
MAQAAHEETFDSTGGLKIFLRSWRPIGRPHALIVICHGVNSHGGQYLWAAEQFVKNGYAVYALDLRGRGRSEGERFYVENVADYVSDVAGVVRIAKSRDAGVPVFLLGHSAGGVVSAVYALENQAELAGFICESFAFQVPAPGFALAAIKGLSHLAPRLPVLKLKNEDFSRDPKAVEALNNDPLTAHEVQPAITVAALVRADERLARSFLVSRCRSSSCTAPKTRQPSVMAVNSSTRPLVPRTRRSNSTRGTITTSSTTSAKRA